MSKQLRVTEELSVQAMITEHRLSATGAQTLQQMVFFMGQTYGIREMLLYLLLGGEERTSGLEGLG